MIAMILETHIRSFSKHIFFSSFITFFQILSLNNANRHYRINQTRDFPFHRDIIQLNNIESKKQFEEFEN